MHDTTTARQAGTRHRRGDRHRRSRGSGADRGGSCRRRDVSPNDTARSRRRDVGEVRFRDSAAVDAMVGTSVETLGGLDVLLHAAGLWQPGIPGQISGEDIDYLVDTNIKAMIFVNQAAYAVMRKGGGGRIINFGSGEAVMGSPISALYAATKGAVSAWTRSIARAWAAEKVSAIALAPAMQTPGADRLREFLGPAAAELIDEEIKRSIPLGGALGDPVDDLGPTLVFLSSEGSRFITGQLIAVDGGLVMLGA